MRDWGRIMVGERLEKMVETDYHNAFTQLVMKGLRKGDIVTSVQNRPAHKASNDLVRKLLKSDLDTLCLLDSDADFSPQFLNVLRDYEPGWQYDALQAFYCRRGWPPEAIWFKRNGNGWANELVLNPDFIEDVDLVGTHTCLFRREIFEDMLLAQPEVDIEYFDWFYYPRHEMVSEDSALSVDALNLGFKLGATTHVRMGHISKFTVGWETYMDYIDKNREYFEKKYGVELEQYDYSKSEN